MSVRTIRQCDRCRAELGGPSPANVYNIAGESVDLCGRCRKDLTSFLNGAKLEEPP